MKQVENTELCKVFAKGYEQAVKDISEGMYLNPQDVAKNFYFGGSSMPSLSNLSFNGQVLSFRKKRRS